MSVAAKRFVMATYPKKFAAGATASIIASATVILCKSVVSSELLSDRPKVEAALKFIVYPIK